MRVFVKPISDVDDDPKLIYGWVEVNINEEWANHQLDCGLTLCILPDGTVIAKP